MPTGIALVGEIVSDKVQLPYQLHDLMVASPALPGKRLPSRSLSDLTLIYCDDRSSPTGS